MPIRAAPAWALTQKCYGLHSVLCTEPKGGWSRAPVTPYLQGRTQCQVSGPASQPRMACGLRSELPYWTPPMEEIGCPRSCLGLGPLHLITGSFFIDHLPIAHLV